MNASWAGWMGWVGTCLLLWTPPAWGAEGSTQEEEEEEEGGDEEKDSPPPQDAGELPEVRVLGTQGDALRDSAGSGSLVTLQEIREGNPADTGEILRRIPGLTVVTEEGAGLRLNLGFRGLNPDRSRRVLLLEDGVPVALNPYGEPDLYYSPSILRVEGIEVVKGSGNILFGPQTIGGVVNFLTLAPKERPAGRVLVSYGMRNAFTLLGNFGASASSGDVRYVLQAFHRRGDGFRDIGYGVTDVMGKVVFTPSRRTQTGVRISFSHEDSQSTYPGLTPGMFAEDPEFPTFTPDDHMVLDRYDVSLVQDVDLGRNTLARVLAYATVTDRVWRRQRYDREPEEGASYLEVVGDPDLPGGAIYLLDSSRINDRRYRVFGLEPRFESLQSTGPLHHRLRFGGRFLLETARRRQFQTDVVVSDAGDLQDDEAHRTVALAAYAEDGITWGPLSLVPGLRLEHVRSRRTVLRTSAGEEPVDVYEAGESVVTALIPGVGVSLGGSGGEVFGGFHVGFAPPRVSSAISDEGTDLELEAERSLNGEGGIRFHPLPFLHGEATGFVLDFRNEIVEGSVASGDATEWVNGGRTLHLGVESALQLDVARALGWDGRLQLSGTYTFSHATFRAGEFIGNRLPYAPLHVATARLDWGFPFGLQGEVAYTHTGSQYTDSANTEEEDVGGLVGRLKPWNVLDASLWFAVRRLGLTFRVTGKGLLNQVYAGSRSPEGIQPAGYRQVDFSITWER